MICCYICDSIVAFTAIEIKNFDKEVLACIKKHHKFHLWQINCYLSGILCIVGGAWVVTKFDSNSFSLTNIILQHNYCERVMHFIRPLSIMICRMIEHDGAFKIIWSMFANQSLSQLHWRAVICQPWSGINHSQPYGKKGDCFGAWCPLKHGKKLYRIVD